MPDNFNRGVIAVDSPQLAVKRLRTIRKLRSSIARSHRLTPKVMSSPPTIAAATAATSLATGTTWQVSGNGVPDLYATACYTFVGGLWGQSGTTYPLYLVWTHTNTVYQGASATPPYAGGYGKVRWATTAPDLELYLTCTSSRSNGYRLKVDGEYVSSSALCDSGSGPNGAHRFVRLTWGDGSAANRKLRYYELETTSEHGFGGIRTANTDKPIPWPVADGLRVLVHGDSMATTVSDSIAYNDYLPAPAFTSRLADFLGQPDTWAVNSGATGWINDAGGTKLKFNERVIRDVASRYPDVVLECGGLNDAAILTDRAAYQALVEDWIAAVLSANPAAIIVLTAPFCSLGTNNTSAIYMAIRDLKKAAAAKFPKSCVFIDNMAEGWTTGSGRVGATTGDGNSDLIRGTDQTHFSCYGNEFFASRVVHALVPLLEQLEAVQ